MRSLPFFRNISSAKPNSRGAWKHPHEEVLHFGSQETNMSLSYDGGLLDHLAEHMLYLSTGHSFWYSLNPWHITSISRTLVLGRLKCPATVNSSLHWPHRLANSSPNRVSSLQLRLLQSLMNPNQAVLMIPSSTSLNFGIPKRLITRLSITWLNVTERFGIGVTSIDTTTKVLRWSR